MAHTHAPELDIAGAVLGSPVGDMASALLRLNGGFHAGLTLMAVAGLRRVWTGCSVSMRRKKAIECCARSSIKRRYRLTHLIHHDLSHHLDLPMADVLALPEVIEMFTDLQLGMTFPQVRLLVVQAAHDEVISVNDVDGQDERHRRGGARVT